MTRSELLEESLTRSAIGAFFEVYNTLGFGFLEHVYIRALEYELLSRGHRVDRELSVAVMYKGIVIARQRLDLVVDGKLIIETNPPMSFTRRQPGSSTTIFAPPASKSGFSSTSVLNHAFTA